MHVQALVSKGSVERFDEAIVRWLAGAADAEYRAGIARGAAAYEPTRVTAALALARRRNVPLVP